MEQAVQKLLVAIKQGVEVMRECKDHMEVRGVDHFRPAFIHPDLFEDCLAVWAVPVAAGIIVEMYMAAFGALADIDAEAAGFAGQDRAGSLPLFL